MSACLAVKVRPGAAGTEVAGYHEGVLVVRVAAPPERGRANRALFEFLAEGLGVAKSALELVSGEAARDKIVRVRGLDREELERRPAVLAGPRP
ncbi:MAG: DUF167 domain-containing protein [Firmicutes bacterium]|nr:DUF167 domain-containing protein [Bacillota bacterium]